MNLIIPFTLNSAAVKGRMIKFDSQINIVLKQHDYPDNIAIILGELLMVGCLLGSQFKDEILLTLQLRMKEGNDYFVADYQYPGNIRGFARVKEDTVKKEYKNIIKDSILMVTIDRKNSNRYQGIVEITNDNLAQAMEEYFQQSEQINTALKLKIGKITLPDSEESWCGGGILIQKLPGKDEENKWNEAKLFFSTIKDHELIDPSLSIKDLLFAVYNEMEVCVYEQTEISHKCRCSLEKIEQVIFSIGYEEAIASIQEEKISINCEFCNKKYQLDKDQIDKLFNQKHQGNL